jgi:glycosyltransferase involved in cell wall biosynthesis
MRISFISPSVNMSGGTRVIAIYAQTLKQMGHEVCIVSPPPRPIPRIHKAKLWLKGRGWPDESARGKSYLDGIRLNHRILDRPRPIAEDDVPDGDVVIATWWATAEWIKTFSPRKGAKVYFIQHHEIHDYLPVDRVRATYRLPFHKIVIAQWLKRLMYEEYNDNFVDLVPNSVDRTQFFAPPRGKQPAPTIGLLYSRAPFKGLDIALAALRLVERRIPELRIISFGTEHPTLSLSLPKQTQYIFSPPQAEIRNLYASCDAWLTASRSEGFNLPALEAMACRTPIVSTRTGWPEEAIKSGVNGLLVDVDNISALAEGVEWVLLQTDTRWRELSAQAHATASEGSWDESARMFEEALKRACCRPMIAR